jgi:hypothetical protein
MEKGKDLTNRLNRATMTRRRLNGCVGKVLFVLCPLSKTVAKAIRDGDHRAANDQALYTHWDNSKGKQWWEFDRDRVSLPRSLKKDHPMAIRLFWVTGHDNNSLYGHWLIPAFSSRKSDTDFSIKGVFTFAVMPKKPILWYDRLPDHLKSGFIPLVKPERVHFSYLNLCFDLCSPFPMCPVETVLRRTIPYVCVPFFVFVFLLSTFSKDVCVEWMAL